MTSFDVTSMPMVTGRLQASTSVTTAPETGSAGVLLEATGLTRHFRIGGPFTGRFLHAVDDMDLTILQHQIVALVGESGIGKTTVAPLPATLFRPTRASVAY